jgi:hypothetical protein
VAYKFIVGNLTTNDVRNITESLLKQERELYDDMLFISIPDLYENLYLKTHAILQWKVSYCPNVSLLGI